LPAGFACRRPGPAGRGRRGGRARQEPVGGSKAVATAASPAGKRGRAGPGDDGLSPGFCRVEGTRPAAPRQRGSRCWSNGTAAWPPPGGGRGRRHHEPVSVAEPAGAAGW